MVVIANDGSTNSTSVSSSDVTSIWSDNSDTLSSISRVQHGDFPLDLSSKHTCSLLGDSSSDMGSFVAINNDSSKNSNDVFTK